MPRLGHKKSRNGCKQCKARHVKCDEKRPCSNCARHDKICSLVTWQGDATPASSATPSNSATASSIKTEPLDEERRGSAQSQAPSQSSSSKGESASSNRSPSASNDAGSSPSTPDPFPYYSQYARKKEVEETTDWTRDLELMNHWTTSTCMFMSDLKACQDVWQFVVPKEAVKHVFLMHEILALSSLHLAHLEQEVENQKAYILLSKQHQDLAIRTMRKALSHPSQENCHSLFMCSILVTLNSFASSYFEENILQTGIDEVVDLFLLMQGVYGILNAWWMSIITGPVGPMLQRDEPSNEPMLEDYLRRIDGLALLIKSQAMQENVRTPCLDAIDRVHEAVTLSGRFSDSRDIRVAYSWPVRLSQDYLNLVRQHEPFALAILSFYSVILHIAYIAEPRSWYLRGYSSRLIAAIMNAMDPASHHLIRWPVEFITGEPTEALDFAHLAVH